MVKPLKMKNAKPLKKKGTFFKLIGNSMLLLSFVTQNFLYETWNARSNELTIYCGTPITVAILGGV